MPRDPTASASAHRPSCRKMCAGMCRAWLDCGRDLGVVARRVEGRGWRGQGRRSCAAGSAGRRGVRGCAASTAGENFADLRLCRAARERRAVPFVRAGVADQAARGGAEQGERVERGNVGVGRVAGVTAWPWPRRSRAGAWRHRRRRRGPPRRRAARRVRASAGPRRGRGRPGAPAPGVPRRRPRGPTASGGRSSLRPSRPGRSRGRPLRPQERRVGVLVLEAVERGEALAGRPVRPRHRRFGPTPPRPSATASPASATIATR